MILSAVGDEKLFTECSLQRRVKVRVFPFFKLEKLMPQVCASALVSSHHLDR